MAKLLVHFSLLNSFAGTLRNQFRSQVKRVGLQPILIALCACIHAFPSFCQTNVETLYLRKNIKQDEKQCQFYVLDEDKHGVWFYKKTKFYYWYKAQNVIATQGASSGDLLHGTYEAFHQNKQLAERGVFKKGLKSGEWMYWRKDGTLLKSEHWSEGKLKGLQTIYDEKGEISETIRIKRWSNERRVGDSLIVTHGNKAKLYVFDARERLVLQEERKHGVLHGKVRHYEEGKLVETKHYKNGEEVIPKEKRDQEAKESFFKRMFKKFKKKEKTETSDSVKEKAVKDKKVKPEKKEKEKKEKEKKAKAEKNKKPEE